LSVIANPQKTRTLKRLDRIIKLGLITILCFTVLSGVLVTLEHVVRADAWTHGQNFPLHFMCDYGNLADKEITGHEFEFNFLFTKGQILETYIANIQGDNATVLLISANGGTLYEQDLYSNGPGFSYSNSTFPGSYLWEFRSEGSTTFIVRASASFGYNGFWIGNCLSGPVSEHSGRD